MKNTKELEKTNEIQENRPSPETIKKAVDLLFKLYAEPNGVDVVITEKKSTTKK